MTPGATSPRRRVSGQLLRPLRGVGVWLGGVTVLSAGARWVAGAHAPPVRQLIVRPSEMATGTRTVRAGNQALAGFPSHPAMDTLEPAVPVSVYVPARCVGTRRCPLLVNLYHGGEWRAMADKYGMIVLFVRNGNALYAPNDSGARFLDAVLTQALRQFAIDPAKIALSGTCGSGGSAFFWGRSNLHVFSRIAVISPANHWGDVTTPPRNTRAQFFIVSGIDERSGVDPGERTDPYLNGYLVNSAAFVREARRDGLHATGAVGLRDHQGRAVDYDHIGRWLAESWGLSAHLRTAPVVVADPPPVLTSAALGQLTAFWQRFAREPDSIFVVGRQTHLRRILVPLGRTRWITWMSDLSVLATRYPAVAADLRAAGLTASQAEAYRLALISARATLEAGTEASSIAPNSVLGQNIAFYKAHPQELEALAGPDTTTMWRNP